MIWTFIGTIACRCVFLASIVKPAREHGMQTGTRILAYLGDRLSMTLGTCQDTCGVIGPPTRVQQFDRIIVSLDIMFPAKTKNDP